MQRLAPFEYRALHPRAFGLWAGKLEFSPPAVRHWLALRKIRGGGGAAQGCGCTHLVSFQFWWEQGLERQLVFSVRVNIFSSNSLPVESEAIWVAHRLTQLFHLCSEPDMVMCHSREIQSVWGSLIRELNKYPRLEAISEITSDS